MRRASKLMTENREKESEARMRCMPDAEPRGLDRASREARMPDAMQSLEALYLHNSRPQYAEKDMPPCLDMDR